MKIVQRIQAIWSGQEIEGGKSHDLESDFDLESADPVHGFCTPSRRGGYLGEVNYKSFKGFRRC